MIDFDILSRQSFNKYGWESGSINGKYLNLCTITISLGLKLNSQEDEHKLTLIIQFYRTKKKILEEFIF